MLSILGVRHSASVSPMASETGEDGNGSEQERSRESSTTMRSGFNPHIKSYMTDEHSVAMLAMENLTLQLSPVTSVAGDCRSPSDPRSPICIDQCMQHSNSPSLSSGVPVQPVSSHVFLGNSNCGTPLASHQQLQPPPSQQKHPLQTLLHERRLGRDQHQHHVRHDSPDDIISKRRSQAYSTPTTVRSLLRPGYELARPGLGAANTPDAFEPLEPREELPNNFLQQANNLLTADKNFRTAGTSSSQSTETKGHFTPRHPADTPAHTHSQLTHALLQRVLAMEGGAALLTKHLCEGSCFVQHSGPLSTVSQTRKLATVQSEVPPSTMTNNLSPPRHQLVSPSSGSPTPPSAVSPTPILHGPQAIQRWIWTSSDLRIVHASDSPPPTPAMIRSGNPPLSPSNISIIPTDQIIVLFAGHQTRVFKDLIARGNQDSSLGVTGSPKETCCFSLVTPLKTLDLECNSEAERDAWLICFQFLLDTSRSHAALSGGLAHGVSPAVLEKEHQLQLSKSDLPGLVKSSVGPDDTLLDVLARLKEPAAPRGGSLSPDQQGSQQAHKGYNASTNTLTSVPSNSSIGSMGSFPRLSSSQSDCSSSTAPSSGVSSVTSTPAFGSPIVSPALSSRSLMSMTSSLGSSAGPSSSWCSPLYGPTQPLEFTAAAAAVFVFTPPQPAAVSNSSNMLLQLDSSMSLPSSRSRSHAGGLPILEPLSEKDEPTSSSSVATATSAKNMHHDMDPHQRQSSNPLQQSFEPIVEDGSTMSLPPTFVASSLVENDQSAAVSGKGIGGDFANIELKPPSNSSTPPLDHTTTIENLVPRSIFQSSNPEVPTESLSALFQAAFEKKIAAASIVLRAAEESEIPPPHAEPLAREVTALFQGQPVETVVESVIPPAEAQSIIPPPVPTMKPIPTSASMVPPLNESVRGVDVSKSMAQPVLTLKPKVLGSDALARPLVPVAPITVPAAVPTRRPVTSHDISRLRMALKRERADNAHLRVWVAHRFMHLQSHINSLMIEQRKLLGQQAAEVAKKEGEFEREIKRVMGAQVNEELAAVMDARRCRSSAI